MGCCLLQPALAGGAAAAETAAQPRYELITGFDVTQTSRFANVALIWAFGNSLFATGWRVKLGAGLGGYDYEGARNIEGRSVRLAFDGSAGTGEALIGYQWRRGSLFFKAYAGFGFADHALTPADPDNPVSGTDFGGKAAIEVWWEPSERLWLSLDGAYADAFGEYWSQARIGLRLDTGTSIGLEGGAMGNVGYDAARAGLFYRFPLGGVELTVSGGFSGDYLEGDAGYYAAFSSDYKF